MTKIDLTAKVPAQPPPQTARTVPLGSSFSIPLVGGDDWEFTFTVLDAAGAPVDLSGMTVSWTLCDENGYRVVQPDEIDIVLPTSPNNVVEIDVPGEVTTRFPQNTFLQALRLIDANGATTTPYLGQIWVTPDPWANRQSLVNWESGLVPPRAANQRGVR